MSFCSQGGLCQGDPSLERDSPLDIEPLDKDPPDRDPQDRDPLDRDPSWTETPLGRDPPGQTPPWTEAPPGQKTPNNEQAIRILLGCILVANTSMQGVNPLKHKQGSQVALCRAEFWHIAFQMRL